MHEDGDDTLDLPQLTKRNLVRADMSRSEIMNNHFVAIVAFTLLLLPHLFHALPETERDEDENEALLRFDLMHVDHPDSPFYVRDRSVAEKFRASLTRSRNWGASFSRKSGNKKLPSTFASPVSYNPAGIFLTPISIGKPPQNFTVILDTGSDITWVQCNPCSACYDQHDPLFEPTKSKAYTTFSCDSEVCDKLRSPGCSNSTDGVPICQYSVKYGDQSTTAGDLSGDAITLTSISGRTKALDFLFGCGRNNRGTFQSTDGIVGFGRGALSLPSQVGTSFGDIFSYCLDAAEKSSPLLLGKGLHRTNFSWSPLVHNEIFRSFYYLSVTGISVNGKLLDIPPSAFAVDAQGQGGIIIDSGTTVTMLVPAASLPLIAEMRVSLPYSEVNAIRFGLDLCYSTANFTDPEFPGVVFHFEGGAELFLPPRNVWVLADEQGTVCFALLSSSYGFSIMGNFQQQNVHIAYDLQNNRIGFQSPVDCGTL